MKIKYLTLIGTALTLAAASGVAIAQSDTGKSNPSDIKLSPAAQTILCKQFPLNSRCADNAGKSGAGAGSSPAPSPAPSGGSEMSPSPAPSGSESPSPAPSGGSEMSPSPAPSGGSMSPGSTNQPSNPPATGNPDNTTSPATGSPNGTPPSSPSGQ